MRGKLQKRKGSEFRKLPKMSRREKSSALKNFKKLKKRPKKHSG